MERSGGGLLLKRFAELAEQARVLDGDDRLRGPRPRPKRYEQKLPTTQSVPTSDLARIPNTA